MKRREFITLLGSAAACPLAARAQQDTRVRRIGVLMGGAGFALGGSLLLGIASIAWLNRFLVIWTEPREAT